jgi:hypothetical protein
MAATNKTNASSAAIRASLVICAIILLTTALYFASSVFAPLAFALFILAIVWPLQHTLEERLPKATALINGNWFVRSLKPLTGRAVLMHGHRHVDWIGECAKLPIISAPSPVMEVTDDKDTAFYIHTLAIDAEGKLRLLTPERIVVPGERTAKTAGAAAG